MAGRRAAASSSAKRTRTAAAAGKTLPHTAPTATSTAAAAAAHLQNDQRRGRRGGYGPDGSTTVDPVEEEDEVTLLYRKPSTRGARSTTAATTSRSTAGGGPGPVSSASPSSAAHASPESSTLAFFQRATGPIHLTRYLLHCGVSDVQQCSDGVVHRVSQQQVFHCSNDRLETAVQALQNMAALIFTPPDTASAPWVGQACWVRPVHHAAVVALARVCEAAVPLRYPSLIQAAVLAATETEARNAASPSTLWRLPLKVAGGPKSSISGGDAEGEDEEGRNATPDLDAAVVELVPSPVRLSDVVHRLRCLRRLRQLRSAYGGLLPRLHAAGSLTELRRCLFSHDAATSQALGRLRQLWIAGGASGKVPASASEQTLADLLSSFVGSPAALDALLPFVGISSRHPHEEALLQHLVGCVKETTAIEASAWGPMAATASWRCSDGLYVVQHASRVRALRRLLAEAQFYGLPRFLRSVRVVDGGRDAAAMAMSTTGADDGWAKAAVVAVQRAQGRHADHFFLTPDALDPAAFSQPDSMQLQLVQEELITLQRTHCAFCLLVGDADRVVTTLQQHLRCAGQAWQHLVKKEEDDREGGSGAGGGVKQESTPDAEKMEEDAGADLHASASPFAAAGATTRASHGAPLRDPLTRYALHTIEAARRHEHAKAAQQAGGASTTSATSTAAAAAAPSLPFSHVQWIGGEDGTNRWSLNAHYYGLVYMVVRETDEWDTEEASVMTEGLLPTTAIAVAEAGATSTLRPPRPVTYCVNAMVELWHC